MNAEQLAYLDAMGIELWVDNQSQTAATVAPTIETLCLVDTKEYAKAEAVELMGKIMQAIGRGEGEYQIAHSFSPEVSAQTLIAFGPWKGLKDALHVSNTIEVPLLSRMLKFPEAKKLAWNKLKHLK